jgi:hypothetical protein
MAGGGRAQQADRIRRIGLLTTFSDSDTLAESWLAAFRKGLDERDWRDGRNVRIDYRRAAGDADRLRAFAKELVALQPDVMFAITTPTVAAVLRETRTLPIVFAQVSDPVGSGFVASLARPGGNVTGFTNINIESSIGGKWLELLKQIAPAVRRVAMIYNPPTAPFAGYYLRPFEAAGPAYGERSGCRQRCRYRERHGRPSRARRRLRGVAGHIYGDTSRPDRLARGALPFAGGLSISDGARARGLARCRRSGSIARRNARSRAVVTTSGVSPPILSSLPGNTAAMAITPPRPALAYRGDL